MNDFYLGLITGIALVNWETLSWVFKKTTACCVRQALRNLDALDVRFKKLEFPVYEEIPEEVIPKPAWQVEEENSKTHDEQPPNESDGDSEDSGAEGASS